MTDVVPTVEGALADRPLAPAYIGVGAAALLLWVALLAGWLPLPSGDAGPMSAPGILEARALAGGIGGALRYLLAWGVMMAAMMLPAMSRVTHRYAVSIDGSRRERAAGAAVMIGVYVLGWTAVGVVPLLVNLVVPIADVAAALGPLFVGGLLVVAGLYQFSARKLDSLQYCCRCDIEARSFDLRDAVTFGRERFVQCLTCTWALFALMVGVGTMNAAVMIALTMLIALERLAARGEIIGTTVGVLMVASGLIVPLTGVPL